MRSKLAVVAGAGGVLGAALLREFSDAGYAVVGLRRMEAAVGPGIRCVPCDLQDSATTRKVIAFASAKFALRGLAQSLAREYQRQGVHVAHVVIDGVLRGSPSVARFDKQAERTIDPQHAARTFRWLAEQAPCARTHEVDLRFSTERF